MKNKMFFDNMNGEKIADCSYLCRTSIILDIFIIINGRYLSRSS